MPFDVDSEQDQDFQDIGGFRLPVPPRSNMPYIKPLPLKDAEPSGGVSVADVMRQQPSPGAMDIRGNAGVAPVRTTAEPAAPNISTPANDGMLQQAFHLQDTKMPPAPSTSKLGDLITERRQAAAPLNPADQKYRMGTGMRVLGTVGNFLSGFGGSHREPTYVGAGATNRRFDVDTERQKQNVSNLDTQIGSTEKLNQENQKLYESGIKQAYETQLGESRSETAKARQSTADAQQQKADTAQQLADLKSDPMRGIKTWQEATVLASREKDPTKRQQLQDLADRLKRGELDIEGAKHPIRNRQLSAKDELLLDAGAKRLGKDAEDLTDDEMGEILGKGRSQRGSSKAVTFKDTPAIDQYSDKWYTQQRQQVRNDKAQALKNAGGDAKAAQDDYAQIEREYQQRAAEFEGRKKQWYGSVQGGKPVTVDSETHQPVASASNATQQANSKPGGDYKFFATSKQPIGQSKQRIGSQDGKTWFDVATGKPVATQ